MNQHPSSALTYEDKLRAVELAAVHGITSTAEKLGLELKTLESWCYRSHRKQYAEFREGKMSEWRSSFAAGMEDLAEKYGEAETLAVEQALKLLRSGDVDAKEIAALVKSMGSSRATAASTAHRARGDADSKSELEINFPALEQAMEALLGRKGPTPVIDVTSHELELPAPNGD